MPPAGEGHGFEGDFEDSLSLTQAAEAKSASPHAGITFAPWRQADLHLDYLLPCGQSAVYWWGEARDGQWTNDEKAATRFEAVVSVPSAELWLLLDFANTQAWLHRNKALTRLRQHLPATRRATKACMLPPASTFRPPRKERRRSGRNSCAAGRGRPH